VHAVVVARAEVQRRELAVLELREGSFEFLDNFKGTITGRQRFFPSATILGGKRIARG